MSGTTTKKRSCVMAEGAGRVLELVVFELKDGASRQTLLETAEPRSFYILHGDYRFVIGEDTITASFGAWVFVPRNTAHAWRCDSAEGRLLAIGTPGGVEAFYRRVGEPVTDRRRLLGRTEPDVEALSRAAADNGIAIVGPPPAA
jgi:quercetin dioxygenase-like cupin family protein